MGIKSHALMSFLILTFQCFAAEPVWAGESSGTLSVSASVPDVVIVEVVPVDVSTSVLNGSAVRAELVVVVDPERTIDLAINAGRNAVTLTNGTGGAQSLRRMQGQGGYIAYELYLDEALTRKLNLTAFQASASANGGQSQSRRVIEFFVKVLPTNDPTTWLENGVERSNADALPGIYTDTLTISLSL